MEMNEEAVQAVCEGLYTAKISAAFKADAGPLLKVLLIQIRAIYKFISPETCTGEIIIFRNLEVTPDLFPENAGRTVTHPSQFNVTYNGIRVIEVMNDGRLREWQGAVPNLVILSDTALIYHYKKRVEKFYAKGEEIEVYKLVSTYASIFASPVFDRVLDALNTYREYSVRKCSCDILKKSWENDKRLYFNSSPEANMRNSLHAFLRDTLAGVFEVRPEQNMDANHPVDIKATQLMSNRHAIIEIKWMGKCRKPDNTIGTKFYPNRANEGAKQLTGYLDADARTAPGTINRGYLVVIDGRRHGLNGTQETINTADGFHYENEEVVYEPAYHQDRDDFEIPLRMFVEPICEDATGA